MNNYERLQNEMPIIFCKDCIHRYSDIECLMRYEEDRYDEEEEDGWIRIHHDSTLDDSFCDRGEN